jgi:NADH:ubiquinone oxidoreductase subunit 3 (subunit A)
MFYFNFTKLPNLFANTKIFGLITYLDNYFIFLCLVVLTAGFSTLLLSISLLVVHQQSDRETLSNYECGFMPFDESTKLFDIKFYLIALSFLLFDIEITFLVPWTLVILDLGFWGFYSIFFFLSLLILCFMYEWQEGALDWGLVR